jgi:hypothetical protein
MRNTFKIAIVLLILFFSCREKYVPNVNVPVTGYLVVDGFINSGVGPTTITLARTTKLNSGNTIQYETKAKVYVEGKLNTAVILLPETSKPGIYANPQLNLNPSDQYRLRIITLTGREYLSDYSAVRRTPDIDSVSWGQEADGLHIYGNTHDLQLPVGYYQWRYEETWEIHSQYATSLKIFYPFGPPNHVGYSDSSTFGNDLSLFFCWKSDTSKNIIVTSTEKLLKNQLSNSPIRFIKANSREAQVRYSILAKLNSISRENMQFLEALRKNTEQLGSIFDAQPSDNMGNIRSVSNPTEIVIGFIEVSEEKSKRIFIDRQQLNSWHYLSGCSLEDTAQNTRPSFDDPRIVLTIDGGLVPTQVYKFVGNTSIIDSFFVAERICVDCNFWGTNKRPSFW